MYDGFMDHSAKNTLLGWICLLMGILPILFLITSCVIGLDFLSASSASACQVYLMFMGACVVAGFVGFGMALFFWRKGPIQLVGTMTRAPLWVSAVVVTVLSVFAGLGYQLVTPAAPITSPDWHCRLPAHQ